MKPKNPNDPADEDSFGVLDEAASLDTAGIGILGSTAQVNVELPRDEDDELADDGVIEGEIHSDLVLDEIPELPVIERTPDGRPAIVIELPGTEDDPATGDASGRGAVRSADARDGADLGTDGTAGEDAVEGVVEPADSDAEVADAVIEPADGGEVEDEPVVDDADGDWRDARARVPVTAEVLLPEDRASGAPAAGASGTSTAGGPLRDLTEGGLPEDDAPESGASQAEDATQTGDAAEAADAGEVDAADAAGESGVAAEASSGPAVADGPDAGDRSEIATAGDATEPADDRDVFESGGERDMPESAGLAGSSSGAAVTQAADAEDETSAAAGSPADADGGDDAGTDVARNGADTGTDVAGNGSDAGTDVAGNGSDAGTDVARNGADTGTDAADVPDDSGPARPAGARTGSDAAADATADRDRAEPAATIGTAVKPARAAAAPSEDGVDLKNAARATETGSIPLSTHPRRDYAAATGHSRDASTTTGASTTSPTTGSAARASSIGSAAGGSSTASVGRASASGAGWPSSAQTTPEPAASVSAAPASAEKASKSTVSTHDKADRPTSAVARRSEPTTARTDVALTAKRLDELGETSRESADLLTADRLLDPHQMVKPEPEGTWSHFLYTISGRRINIGDGKRARARKALSARIAAPLSGGARFVPVLSRKGGVGKTTITTLLGMALADARDDRVIAVDANPDRGTLAERIVRSHNRSVRDLVRIHDEVRGYHDLSAIVARDATRLDVLASDTDPRVAEAFSDDDYRDVADVAAHYYSLVLTDTGTGIVHSVMAATLDLADQLVIVSGLSVDEARLASETLTWLETNGHAELARDAIIVLNQSNPGHPLVRLNELQAHFATRARHVVRMPYDTQIAGGGPIVYANLQPETRQAARELAALLVEGLRAQGA